MKENLCIFVFIIGRVECTVCKSQCKHTFIMCKNLQKDLVIVPDMQQFHQLGYNWTANG